MLKRETEKQEKKVAISRKKIFKTFLWCLSHCQTFLPLFHFKTKCFVTVLENRVLIQKIQNVCRDFPTLWLLTKFSHSSSATMSQSYEW